MNRSPCRGSLIETVMVTRSASLPPTRLSVRSMSAKNLCRTLVPSALPISAPRSGRLVSVHGPGAIKLLASAILDVAIERFMGLGPLVIDSTPVEQRLVHIDDLIQACLHVIDHPDTVGRTFNVASGVYPTSHEVAEILGGLFGMTLELDDDPDCGPDYDERQRAWSSMLERGMRDDIILTKERCRFMRKANRNSEARKAFSKSLELNPKRVWTQQQIEKTPPN